MQAIVATVQQGLPQNHPKLTVSRVNDQMQHSGICNAGNKHLIDFGFQGIQIGQMGSNLGVQPIGVQVINAPKVTQLLQPPM